MLIKINNLPSDKKSHENIFEFSILGISKQNFRNELKTQIEEIFENSFLPYYYKISTYFLQSNLGSQNVTNLIELHQNMTKNYQTTEYKIDNDEFYNNVNYMEKIDEYIILSKYYLKYTTPAFINFPLGNSNIVEISRCEKNMDIILSSLGYREKSHYNKTGDFIKYKNMPVIVMMSAVEKSDQIVVEGSSSSATHQRRRDSFAATDILEIIGYCYENEKESMMKLLSFIVDKIDAYCYFENEINKNI
jgi:hypothetical protein